MTKAASTAATSTAPQLIKWQADGWTIALAVENGTISQASLQWSSPATGKFLEMVTQRIVGMGLREARDHGVQYACLAAQPAGAAPAVSGIVIPANYSETSRAVVKALRAAIDQTLQPDPTQWNFEDHGLSEAWRKIAKDVRQHRLEVLIKEFLQKLDLSDAAAVTEIDEYDRVFLQFSQDMPVAQKSTVLMQLERDLRGTTGERIELFVSEMKDNNRIRRL